ncbi:SGNH/GDSL hydrolase family protein [Paenibacillus eucommiae]|uniref:Lysophospholipase L1-like esterase n=1 Tax=Paenibacillus eucommiae TaxID=1355755 RepID=A0ABS4J8C5_9BACL|nr:GDSL-type esterase/lipase family protein [Paenibacillus eucommiae]MBP1996073.1 lysophospholipase L1-like esterase [Paenibacillus eucommiae]
MTVRTKSQIAESFVFVKEEKLPLRYRHVDASSIRLRSHANAEHPDAVVFVEGEDYVVDAANGLIGRTAGSRIADWSKNVLYGVTNFDHTKYEDWSNAKYTVFADYEYEPGDDEAGAQSEVREPAGPDVLKGLKEKLARGEEITYVVHGDSISTGGEASEEKYTYFGRFAERLSGLYPGGSVRIVNTAIGGEDSRGGVARVATDVLSHAPDLVTIGYGMNDQNKFEFGNGVPLAEYEANIREMIETIRSEGNAVIILVTPCEPNPLWQHTSGTIGKYAEVLLRLASEYGIGAADAHAKWVLELEAGKTPGSLLLNNINHPNDYGHWIYFTAFEAAFFGEGV